MKTRYGLIAALVTALTVMPLAAGAADTVLKAVSALPTNTEFSQQFVQFVKKVNSDPELDVEINYLGGPEVIPKKTQSQALKSGVVDIVYSPSNYFFDAVPATAALGAATITPAEARKNGGIAFLDSLFNKQLNAHFLGWFGAIDKIFNIYTVERPTFSENGQIEGEPRIRSTAFYRGVITGMGGDPVNISAPNVYTAMQRGIVTGLAWPTIGITNLGWDDFIRYRLEPGFFRMNTIAIMNLDSWKALTEAQRQKLQALVVEYEAESRKAFENQQTDIKANLKEIQAVELKGAALERYQKLVQAAPWKNLENYGGGDHEDKLRALFTPGESQ